MEPQCASGMEQKPKLALRSSQIHVQRLKKLKQKLSFQTPSVSHYTPSRAQSFFNTKFCIPRSTSNNLNPFGQTTKRQENTAPNKSNYFQSMNLKNIQSQNKILYKKIQKIVKRKTNSLISEQRNQLKKSSTAFDQYEQTTNNDALNVTSDLAEEMIKNRATRSLIKQQQIKNENFKMLQRLMTLKPTIQTKKILNQTRKQREISKRMSKFNSFHTIQSDKNGNQKDQNGEPINILLRKLSLQSNYHGKNQSEYEIPFNLTKKNHISTYQEGRNRLLPESPSFYRRTNTQPIQSLDNIKLPNLSPSNTTHFNSFGNIDKQMQELRKRALSQNLKYLENSKSLPKQKRQFSAISYGQPNQTYNLDQGVEQCQMNLFKAKKALEKQKVHSQRDINKKSPKRFILLGEIVKKIENLNVRFRFVRLSSSYEIQIAEKKMYKKDKKVQKPEQNIKQHMSLTKYKGSNSISDQQITSLQPIGIKKIQQRKNQKKQNTNKRLKFAGQTIIFDEQMGSALFSSYDYDYHRIVQKCLALNIDKDNWLNIKVKEQFKECSRHSIRYHQDSIRENDQDEEQDSADSMPQE